MQHYAIQAVDRIKKEITISEAQAADLVDQYTRLFDTANIWGGRYISLNSSRLNYLRRYHRRGERMRRKGR